MGLIHEIELLVNTGKTVAGENAKFYVEVSANSDFTNSVKYGFGSEYSNENNITLSEGSTISDVLTKSGSIIKIDVSGDNASYVKFYWESGASYFTNIIISYFPK